MAVGSLPHYRLNPQNSSETMALGEVKYNKIQFENSQLTFETQVLTTAATGTSGKSREKEKGSSLQSRLRPLSGLRQR